MPFVYPDIRHQRLIWGVFALAQLMLPGLLAFLQMGGHLPAGAAPLPEEEAFALIMVVGVGAAMAGHLLRIHRRVKKVLEEDHQASAREERREDFLLFVAMLLGFEVSALAGFVLGFCNGDPGYVALLFFLGISGCLLVFPRR